MRLRLPVLLASLILAAAAPAARADLLITVDKDAQRMDVAVDGQTRYSWPVSTGVAGYDTPNGSYRPFRMEASHFSREWDNAPMPHAIFFTQIGHAIHGTNQTRRLGRAASHGCVRLSPRNAATLFALVKQQKMAATRVVIEGSVESPAASLDQRGLTPPPRRRAVEDDVVAMRARAGGWDEDLYAAPVRRGRDPFDDVYAAPRGRGYDDLY